MSRGVGLFCAAMGAAHWAVVLARPGSALYFAHFLLLVLGGFGYLTWTFARARVFRARPLVDLLLAIGGFVLLLPAMAWRTGQLAPGFFLVLYGCARIVQV